MYKVIKEDTRLHDFLLGDIVEAISFHKKSGLIECRRISDGLMQWMEESWLDNII